MLEISDDLVEEGRPSRSEKKRASTEIMEFAVELSKLTPKQLAGLGLPEDVLEGLQLAQRIPSYAAKNRQVKNVGGIIRKSGCFLDLQQKYLQNIKVKHKKRR